MTRGLCDPVRSISLHEILQTLLDLSPDMTTRETGIVGKDTGRRKELDWTAWLVQGHEIIRRAI